MKRSESSDSFASTFLCSSHIYHQLYMYLRQTVFHFEMGISNKFLFRETTNSSPSDPGLWFLSTVKNTKIFHPKSDHKACNPKKAWDVTSPYHFYRQEFPHCFFFFLECNPIWHFLIQVLILISDKAVPTNLYWREIIFFFIDLNATRHIHYNPNYNI